MNLGICCTGGQQQSWPPRGGALGSLARGISVQTEVAGAFVCALVLQWAVFWGGLGILGCLWWALSLCSSLEVLGMPTWAFWVEIQCFRQ